MVGGYIKQRIWGLQRSLFFPSFFSCRERPLLAGKSIERREHHFKREFALFQTSMILFSFIEFVYCWRNFLGLNPKEPYLSLENEKENFCVVLTYFVKRVREIWKFHVAVVQQRLRNVQKSVVHVHSCCFADINLLLFSRSLCRRLCRCVACMFFFIPIKVPGELDPLSFYKLCVHMHVSKTKFERKSSLEYYHRTCFGKTKHTS